MTEPAQTAKDPGYEFTQDWFSGNTRTWQQLFTIIKPRRFLEIGSFEGRSTCWIIEAGTKTAEDSIEVTCIDTWQGGAEHQPGAAIDTSMPAVERRFDANIALAKASAAHGAEVTKIKDWSNLALADLISARTDQRFDLVYIDGSHQSPDVMTDAVMAFQLLRVGGLMIFDDYLWSMDQPGHQDIMKMPKPAIDAFLNVFQRKMQVYRGAPLYQLYTYKVSD